ncbi:hypothetical protein F5146DRAFT_551255 [Armillaria mellea]|nr:hypothetical protein F5146DRAFT_551255 [Armillaria mellea]
MAPMSPAPPAAYGPPPRPGIPPVQHHNPLPEPPRDLYASSPYNAILDLPQTKALLTASISKDLPQKSKGLFGKSKGLLRSLSSKKKEPRIHFVPVNVGANGYRSDAGPSVLNRSMAPSSSGSISGAPPPVTMNAASAPPPPIVQMPVPDPAEPPPPVIPEPRPDVPPSVIRITFDNEYRDFCNHSFHRVMYNNQTYDTAMHLFEAMKFLPDNPQLADNIRLCKNIGDVFPMSANFAQYQRSDWGDVHKTILEEVLYHKYGQNPDVRNLLLNTGSAELVYFDPSDSYWSEGPDGQGQNHLGKALMRVRERLKAMGYKK